MLGASLVRDQQLYAWLAIRRNERRGVYSVPQIRAANYLAPHLGRVIKLRCKIEIEQTTANRLHKSLDAVVWILHCRRERQSAHRQPIANRAGDAILTAGDEDQSWRTRLRSTTRSL